MVFTPKLWCRLCASRSLHRNWHYYHVPKTSAKQTNQTYFIMWFHFYGDREWSGRTCFCLFPFKLFELLSAVARLVSNCLIPVRSGARNRRRHDFFPNCQFQIRWGSWGPGCVNHAHRALSPRLILGTRPFSEAPFGVQLKGNLATRKKLSALSADGVSFHFHIVLPSSISYETVRNLSLSSPSVKLNDNFSYTYIYIFSFSSIRYLDNFSADKIPKKNINNFTLPPKRRADVQLRWPQLNPPQLKTLFHFKYELYPFPSGIKTHLLYSGDNIWVVQAVSPALVAICVL